MALDHLNEAAQRMLIRLYNQSDQRRMALRQYEEFSRELWTIVVFGEEMIFHGFLMSQLIKLLGSSFLALLLNVVLTSIIFGLAHSYQGRSETWSTGLVGVCLSATYILSGFNLWLPILVHGVINSYIDLRTCDRSIWPSWPAHKNSRPEPDFDFGSPGYLVSFQVNTGEILACWN